MKSSVIIKLLPLLFVFFPELEGATNYCSLCSNHVACGNNGRFYASCPNDATIVALNGGNFDTVLRVHNNVRSLLADGKIPGFRSASKMSTLKWDAELASLAELNIRQCQMKHDGCRSTEQYRRAGQNIYYYATTGGYRDLNVELSSAINAWFEEYKLASQSDVDNCCGGNKFSKIGHFLQVAQDQAVAVGCGVARYTNNGWRTTLITCNYSYGNVLNNKVYTSGAPASACPNGRNNAISGLCNS